MVLYRPREDSYLLARHVQKLAKGRVLDMGTGSGILAATAAKKSSVSSVLAVDIQKSSVEHCRRSIKSKKITFRQSNLFEKVNGKFDTITFNPPYLPGDVRLKDITVEGGKKGYETLERFFNKVSAHLNPDGIILIVFSSLTDKKKVNEMIESNLFEFAELEKKGFFMEELYIYLIRKTDILKMLEKKGVKNARRFAKGHRGLIFTGILGKNRIAVKMQRKDIGAEGTVTREAGVLKELNRHSIGPKILFSGEDYFGYIFVEGVFIPEFLEKASKKNILAVLKDVFMQCYKLDELGINKEEMHHPYKHIVVSKRGKPVLLDFERAKKTEKPQNVTQFVQYVTSAKFGHLVKEKLSIDHNKIRKLAEEYKKDVSMVNLKRIISCLS